MSKEILERIKPTLDGMLNELNALKASICVLIVYVEQELAKILE